MINRLESMDVLRGCAAIFVLLYHMEELGVASWPHFFHWGWIGVDLFFVLSGFFITICVLKPKEWKPFDFIKRRFIRIAPPYYISMVFVVAMSGFYFASTDNGLLHVLVHLLFLHTYIDGAHGSINGVYWSLGVEFSFYIFMLLTAKCIRRGVGTQLLILSMIVMSWVWRAGCYYFLPEDPMQRFIWSTQLLGMLDEFAIGSTIAIIYSRYIVNGNVMRWPIVYFSLSLGIALVALFVYNIDAGYWSNIDTMVFSRTYLSVGFSLVILSFTFLEHKVWFRALCRYSGLSFLGSISYSIYLFHLPIINAGINSGVSRNHSFSISILCCVLLVSAISYRFFEKPFMRSR